jgi:hypothetical protein
MNEQMPIAGHISIAADRAAAYTEGTVAPVQDLVPEFPALQRGVKESSDLLTRLFRGFDRSLALRLWNGTTLSLGNAGRDNLRPSFTLVRRHPSVVRSLVIGRDPMPLVPGIWRNISACRRDAGDRSVAS